MLYGLIEPLQELAQVYLLSLLSMELMQFSPLKLLFHHFVLLHLVLLHLIMMPMFEVAWIPFLAGLSGPLQDTDDLEVVELCLDGFKSAIKIVCVFDLELERNAFVTTLGKFTFLNNLGEMKTKNMEAIKALLDVAVNEGNNLKGSWREVLTCVSQLEHMQLISSGVELPDNARKR